MFMRPTSCAFLMTGQGKSPVRSYSAATGMISFCVKFSAKSNTSRCSDVKLKL